jgi:hypothetical protein
MISVSVPICKGDTAKIVCPSTLKGSLFERGAVIFEHKNVNFEHNDVIFKYYQKPENGNAQK